MVSSAEDMAKWLVFNMNGGKFNGRQIMPVASLEEVLSPQINQSRSFYKFKRYAYSLGWNLGTYEGEKFIHCFGEFAGFRPHVSFMPEHNIGVVVLVNESSESIFLPDLIAADIYDYLLGKKPLQVESNPRVEEILSDLRKEREENKRKAAKDSQQANLKPMSFDLKAYTGTYENDELGKIVISNEDSLLLARFGNLTSKLIHKNEDTFQADFKVLSPVNLSFKGDKESGVTELSLIGRNFTKK